MTDNQQRSIREGGAERSSIEVILSNGSDDRGVEREGGSSGSAKIGLSL